MQTATATAMSLGAARALLVVVTAAASCAGQAPEAGAPDGREPVRAIPLSICRAGGALNDPCFPTPSEIGSRPVHPCFDRRRGRCGGVGQGMCYLLPLADGKRCSSGEGVCRDLRCEPE
jgi:hypothetical protein